MPRSTRAASRVSTDERARLKDLERENKDLRRANEMAESTGGRTGPVTIDASRSQGSVMVGILTHEQKQLAFRLRARGRRLVDIARQINCSAPMVGLIACDCRFTVGVPDQWEPRRGCLSIADREEILIGIRSGQSLSSIAQRLGRVPSTVTGEVAANGGREGYSAWAAHQRARQAATRPKPCKLRQAGCSRQVSTRLEQLWSPDEIARRLPLDFPDDPQVRVSHETIFQSLFVQGRGDLRGELARCLRSARTSRKQRGRVELRGRIRRFGSHGGVGVMVAGRSQLGLLA